MSEVPTSEVRRVVVVDDEDDVREIARVSLEAVHGWDVVEAADCAAAVEAATRLRPDVVLLDVMMPGRDGPATLAALRAQERTRDIPIVFLTAKTQDRDREHLLGLGAVGVVAKPFDPLTLGDELARLLGWDR